MEESNPELESFRQQWRAEVSAKGIKKPHTSSQTKQPRKPAFDRLASTSKPQPADEEREGDHVEPQMYRSLAGPSRSEGPVDKPKVGLKKDPSSALEHYEKAVEKETQGSLGDSLDLYRKAFRMDDRVDHIYKNKHFPPSSFPTKAIKPNPSNAAATVSNPAHPSLQGPPQTIQALIAGFSGLHIEGAPPAIEGTDAPRCFIAELPEEILIHVLKSLALQDIPSFVRLAQVCKRMAFLVSTEEQIWKRVCQGAEVGFGAMHYQWQREVLGGLLKDDLVDAEQSDEDISVPILSPAQITESLLSQAYSSSWHQMFRLRPRIRFNGCYISTVNYTRAGQASPSQVTWNSPIHIITYFRYLRFFRDGTVISLLSTTEPAEVVHHLTKELQDTHRGGGSAYLPSIIMKNALRGRWRLSTNTDNPSASLKEAEGEVFVETEGANEKYMYRMKFSLRTTGKTARNNKLAWEGFWNYNMLTGDTGEFELKNEKKNAFFFSRVKSYGLGA